MSNTEVNTQLTKTIESLQQSTLTGTLIKHSGAGKAYQSVSQSSAIAVQDATDTLRNISTMSTTAMGVAISQMLATGDVSKYAPIIKHANEMVKDSAANFQTIGKNASSLLDSFPTGD